MQNRHFLSNFLEPGSVALIGVSVRTGRGSFNLLENLLTFGYPGKIYPVHPQARDILGFRVYRDVQSIPEAVDLAVILTPREIVPGLVRQCAERDIKGIIIATEGFGEADETGKRLEAEIKEIVAKTRIRVLGPNSIGVLNAFHSFSSSFVPFLKKRIPVALISQSGGFLEGFPGCPFGKGIDLGNTCDVDFSDGVAYFEGDKDIRVIVLHMEGLGNIRGFLDGCRKAVKPILVLKGGKSEQGRVFAKSHTGSLTGKDELYRAMFKQAGIHEIDSTANLGNVVKAFLYLPSFTGNRVVVISPTGAGGIMTLDAMETHGFEPAVLSSETIAKIAHLFRPWKSVSNPLDILSAGMAYGYKHVYREVFEACLTDENVDILFAICGAFTLKTVKDASDKFPHKPVVAWALGGDQSLIFEKGEAFGFEPYYLFPETAMYALKVLRDYYTKRLSDQRVQ